MGEYELGEFSFETLEIQGPSTELTEVSGLWYPKKDVDKAIRGLTAQRDTARGQRDIAVARRDGVKEQWQEALEDIEELEQGIQLLKKNLASTRPRSSQTMSAMVKRDLIDFVNRRLDDLVDKVIPGEVGGMNRGEVTVANETPETRRNVIHRFACDEHTVYRVVWDRGLERPSEVSIHAVVPPGINARERSKILASMLNEQEERAEGGQ